jgi:endoglycosylceramidase
MITIGAGQAGTSIASRTAIGHPTQVRRLPSLVAVLLVALTGVAAAAGGAPHTSPRHGRPTAAVPQLHRDGRWLVDPYGRVVVVHGLNAVWKHAPWAPPATAEGFTARDADFMAANGFNAVRLGVLFAGVMPRQGVVDTAYLDLVDRVVQLLASRHIWVLLDFHQDDYATRFTGEGFPEWAVHDDGLPFAPMGSFFANYFSPALARTFDNLWGNSAGLWDDYAKAWSAVAERWRDQPYLMGYDLFNEPSAGSQLATCFNPAGCPVFDQTLQSFYEHVRTAIRTKDGRNLVWYEPHFFFNAMAKSNFTKVADDEVGLSWHNYACTPAFTGTGVIPGEPDCVLNEPRVFANADQQVSDLGSTGVMTEFGSTNDLPDLARLTGLADANLDGWMYWAYKAWNDPTGQPATEGMFAKDDDLSSLIAGKADVLIRPFPQAIAGTPTALSWDASTSVMQLTYRAGSKKAPTEIFVPQRHYPRGYRVVVTGGRVVSKPNAPHLLVVAKSGSTVSVAVQPPR